MENKEIVTPVSPSTLIPNKTKTEIYKTPTNYEEIKKNIQERGILEPLLVNRKTNVIISGNLRLQIALELGLPVIPVILKDLAEEEMGIISISTNQQRIKSTLDILKEIRFYEEHYKIPRGGRTDKNPELKKIKEERDSFLKQHSKNTIEKLKAIDKLAVGLYPLDSEEYLGIFKTIDSGKTTLNGMSQQLIDMTNRKHNELVVPEKFEIIRKHTKIYQHSSEDMHEVETGSVNSIITSPPYLRMKDYGNGENELGQEKQIEMYLLNLMKIFKECYRVLRDDGSLFVNSNDCVLGGEYQAVPHYFVIEMLKLGWILNDEILWIKNNPTYTKGRRSVRSHEPIFHFVKSRDFYYNDNWLKYIKDPEDKMSYGTKKSSPKIKSAIDYRDGVLATNVSSTKELRKKFKEEAGIYLTHSATFPLAVPAICALISTKKYDTILDCFAGTSTVGKFALSQKRNFIGYEVNPRFIKASEINLIGLQFYNIIRPDLRTGGNISLNVDSELKYWKGDIIKNASSPFFAYDKIKPVSPDLKKSFGIFTKAFNDCYRVVQKMR